MKNKLTLSFCAFVLSIASVSYGQQIGHQHTDHLSVMIDHYLAAKNALSTDDFETAKKQVSLLGDEVLNNEEMNNHELHKDKHMKHHSQMGRAVRKAKQAEDIAELRSAFLSISENLIKAVRNQNYDEEKLYLQYCPMANSGQGGYWLSERENIENPYYGFSMKSCGTLKELN